MNTSTIKVTAVERKEGVSQKTQKPWTKFIVHSEGGAEFATFDASLANVANGAVGRHANVTFESGQYGNDLKGLTVDENAPAEVPVVRDRDPNGNADWDLIGLRKTRCALWAALFSGDLLKGMDAPDAANRGIFLVKAAEEDTFHREPAQKDDSIPFKWSDPYDLEPGMWRDPWRRG